MAALSLHCQAPTEQLSHKASSLRKSTRNPPGLLVGSLNKPIAGNSAMESSSLTLRTNLPAKQTEPLSNQPTSIPRIRRSKSQRNEKSRLSEPFVEDERKIPDVSDSLGRTEKSSKPLRSILHHSSRHGKSCSDLSCDIGFMSSGKKKKRASARHRVFDQALAPPRKEATESLNKESLATVQAKTSPTSITCSANPPGSDPGEETLNVPDVQANTREKVNKSAKTENSHPTKNLGKLEQESPVSHTSSKDLHQLILQPIRNTSSDATSRHSRRITDLKLPQKPAAHYALPDCPFDDDFLKLEKKNSERSLGIVRDDEESVSHVAANVSLFDMSELTDDLELSLLTSDSVDVAENSMLQLNICDPVSVDVLSLAGSKKKVEMFDFRDRIEEYELYGDQTAETEALEDSDSSDSDEISLTPSLADLLCVEDLAPLSIGEGNRTSFSRQVCYVVD